MKINRATGLIEGIDYRASTHCDKFPDPNAIDLLVIHCISLPPGEFTGDAISDFFTAQLNVELHPYYKQLVDMKVSAHALIRRDGHLIQFVPFTKRAWHAGVSCFKGRNKCNDFSIGIELEGTDDTEFTEEQYQILAKLTQNLSKIYTGITQDRIVGHSDISPQRKTDPGPFFNWQKYFALL